MAEMMVVKEVDLMVDLMASLWWLDVKKDTMTVSNPIVRMVVAMDGTMAEMTVSMMVVAMAEMMVVAMDGMMAEMMVDLMAALMAEMMVKYK